MSLERSDLLEFGPFQADRRARLLLRGGEVVPLPPKAFDVLRALLEADGHALTREELMQKVWGEVFVEEANLTQAVSVLRRTLGDESYIVTIPRRGYKFGVPVTGLRPEREQEPEPEASPPPTHAAKSRWIWVAAAGILLLGAGLLWYRARPATEPIQSLVVLPFVNLSADPNQEYFSDGLTEEVINALATAPGLRVVARTSPFQFKGKGEDIRTIAQKLGVDAVLEGSVRIDGEHLRVTAQLNDARNGYHYWSRTWDHGMKDVLAVQLQIAREVFEALGRKDAAPAIKQLTSNLTAYDFYLQGAFFAEKVADGKLPQAVAALSAALKEDPSFAAAYGLLARTYQQAAKLGRMAPSKAFPLARQNVEKALALDPEDAEANTIRGSISLYNDWDFPTAWRALTTAAKANPSNGTAHHELAHYFLAMRRFDEAMAESQKQIAINPVDAGALDHISIHYHFTGDYPRAVLAAQRALAVDPRDEVGLVYLQWAYEDLGQFEAAVDAVSRRVIATPTFVDALRKGLKQHGPAGYWQACYDFTEGRPVAESLRARMMAIVCARLGRREEMLVWLGKAIDLRDTYVVDLNVEPAFAPFRKDPGFQKLVRRVGLP